MQKIHDRIEHNQSEVIYHYY